MSPVMYFTHLLGLWRVVLSADFKERKLVAVVVVHPFTEVVTDVESPAGSENGQRNTFMSQCCFGLVIIKKISKSSPTSSDCKVAVILCDSVSFVPQGFLSAVSHTVISSRTSLCSGGGSDLSSTLCCRFQRESNNPQHVLFCVYPVHVL